MNELSTLAGLVQSGGNIALLVCVYYMYKLNDRLAKIEAVLSLIAKGAGLELDIFSRSREK